MVLVLRAGRELIGQGIENSLVFMGTTAVNFFTEKKSEVSGFPDRDLLSWQRSVSLQDVMDPVLPDFAIF